MSDVERELAAVMRRVKRHADTLEELTAERDRLILEAITDRVPRSRIIAITELSPARIEQIRRAARVNMRA